MPCLTLVRDHHDIDWRGLGWSLPARLPGTLVGVWVVTDADRSRARDRDRGRRPRRGGGHLARDRGPGQPDHPLGRRVRQRHHRHGDVDRRAADRDRLPAPAGPRDPHHDGGLLPGRRRPVAARRCSSAGDLTGDQAVGRRSSCCRSSPSAPSSVPWPGARSPPTSSVRPCCSSARRRPLSCSSGPCSGER